MEQNNAYVFISYAHKDSHLVLPCVNAMQQSGIRLWYDDGIEAGSEWPEFIADKVVNCTKFILFISDAYLDSQNCRRELNFAISRKKDILSIFLGDVTLSPGMEMQLGTYQALYRKRFGSDAQFHTSLCGEHFFDICRLGGPTASLTTGSTTQYYSSVSGTASAAGAQPSAFVAAAASVENTWNSAKKTVTTQVSGFVNDLKAQGKKSTFGSTDTVKTAPLRKKRSTAALLSFFLGWIGIHKFYLRQPIWGVVYILLCRTYIPFAVSVVEGIALLCCSKETLAKFYKKYEFE